LEQAGKTLHRESLFGLLPLLFDLYRSGGFGGRYRIPLLALPRRIENWSLTSLQQRLVKNGGRLVQHARYYWLLLAEGHLNRRRFAAMLGRIALLPAPMG
jgi:hypothetical protein